MKEFCFTIKDERGIHARPAAMLAASLKHVKSVVYLQANGKTADACKLMDIMRLGVRQGNRVTVKVEGIDEDSVITQLKEFFLTYL